VILQDEDSILEERLRIELHQPFQYNQWRTNQHFVSYLSLWQDNIMDALLTWLTIVSNQKPREPINPTRDDPCISPVSLSPVSTYVDRPALSKDMSSKMGKPCGNKSLVHALAVTGLGGTGKTQLVLRYIEQHKQK
jgi:hypothetical protein